ncbi:GNAT family N-acetyltransferase [uncultured Eudoraea sp.]|uniref:GNAT family N-acetyltransferase n=1 Tax=uncultured Eudoraea sp. TaxID=1035614 RepID=UPI002634127E|nr:GNAT family N-acetyltransferase [uncultured Eudoraea sp.]
MELKFFKCSISDLDQLIALSRETFIEAFEAVNNPEDFKSYMQKAFSKKQLKRELEDMHMTFYFVTQENEILGYFKLNEDVAQTETKDKHAIELERIYVKRAYQGKKIGEWMLNQIKRIAVDQNKSYLWLGVWEKNHNAIRFYEKSGFMKFGRHPYYIGSDKQMDWLMKFDLVNLVK